MAGDLFGILLEHSTVNNRKRTIALPNERQPYSNTIGIPDNIITRSICLISTLIDRNSMFLIT